MTSVVTVVIIILLLGVVGLCCAGIIKKIQILRRCDRRANEYLMLYKICEPYLYDKRELPGWETNLESLYMLWAQENCIDSNEVRNFKPALHWLSFESNADLRQTFICGALCYFASCAIPGGYIEPKIREIYEKLENYAIDQKDPVYT